ncbi:MAG TPA: DNA-binding response regulator [Chitinophagaceae bacterium]|jgi:two-component system, LytTR family, response regulator|nr:DNA-binding response regulator [Chitinophagaceae bacterium]
MKIIIVDDEPLARSIIREYLQYYPELELIAECNDGFEGVKAIHQLQPDLIFLDVQMPKINGFEMLELIEDPPAVIFTTAYDEYAIRAFESHAVDYLLKPFSRDRFDKSISRWLHSGKALPGKERIGPLLDAVSGSPAEQHRVVVKLSGKIRIIPVDDIHYFEAADDFVKIHTKDGAFLKNKTMGHFETVLNKNQFVRTHRSYIVNISEITRIDPYEKDNHLAILKSGGRVPVSKTGYGKLKSVLGL